MRFLHVDPAAKTVKPVEAKELPDVQRALHIGNVDHGVVFKTEDEGGVGIVVYEYGLMEGDGPYFELRGNLYSGDAVLYAFDRVGETIDMRQDEDFLITPNWLPTKEDVELAIAAGLVQRPEARINGALVWSWT